MTNDDTNPKDLAARCKPGIRAIPPSAMLHLGRAMEDGVRKYGLMNWRQKQVLASVYYEAIGRHAFAWWDGQDYSTDTAPPVHHLAHVAACCAILLDAMETGNLLDDRPHKGNTPELIERMRAQASGAPAAPPAPVSIKDPGPSGERELPDWTNTQTMPKPGVPRIERGLDYAAGKLYFEGVEIADVEAVLMPSALGRFADLVLNIAGHPDPGAALLDAKLAQLKAEQEADSMASQMAAMERRG